KPMARAGISYRVVLLTNLFHRVSRRRNRRVDAHVVFAIKPVNRRSDARERGLVGRKRLALSIALRRAAIEDKRGLQARSIRCKPKTLRPAPTVAGHRNFAIRRG